jgi:hypothetical protein
MRLDKDTIDSYLAPSASRLKMFLEKSGIPCQSSMEQDELSDGEVVIDDTWHVQVGNRYYIVVREVNECFEFGKALGYMQDVVTEFKKRLKEVKNESN